MVGSAHLRIGELSRRVGVPPELLRAWEQRYGLLQPVRSAGGFRLYTTADENRVRSMRGHLDAGISAAQAARLALAEPASEAGDEGDPAGFAPLRSDLGDALDRLDEPRAHAALDRLLARFTLQTVLRDVLLPYLHELGERWKRGEASVAQEHFSSNLLRGRLLGLARGWGQSAGPRAVLACAPGELHDLPLIIFGLALAGRGWSITYFGPDTPIASIQEALGDVKPRLVVVSSTTGRRLRAAQAPLTELAREVPVALAGAGATDRLARATGASLLQGDPVTAAERLADEHR
jgi:DNA-binding transcriptional MerR regulator